MEFPLKKIAINPWQYLTLSFSLLIVFGSFLLLLPFVTHPQGVSVVDAVFTATSAICVTGLTTIPTSGFNTAGQLSILLLIQLGAIGIMTLTSSFLLALKGSVSLKHKISFSKLQDNFEIQDANDILNQILKITFVTEFVGFVLLSIGFLLDGLPFKNALYQGFFHSISAFCNAGFSTYDTSIMGMNPLIKIAISLLIIMGGLGYFVIFEWLENSKGKRKLSLHSKIVLRTTLALVVIGTLLLFVFESGKMSLLDSFFQSVTTRTAGFNSVDLTQLSSVSIFLMLILMFIGGSSGSTAGGIKTTTFFIIIYSIVSLLKGKTDFVIFNRSIPLKVVVKAFATAVMYFVIISVGVILLLEESKIPLKESLFEAISAMGTVGLTLNITPNLDAFGKIVLIILMFIGRLGPASLAMATLSKEKEVNINYPKGNIY